MSVDPNTDPLIAHAEAVIENAKRLERTRDLSGIAGLVALPTCFGIAASEFGTPFAQVFGKALAIPCGSLALAAVTGGSRVLPLQKRQLTYIDYWHS